MPLLLLVEHHIITFNPNGQEGDAPEQVPNLEPILKLCPYALFKLRGHVSNEG